METFKSPYKTTVHRKFNTWCNYTQRIDTYGCGCLHDCKYCYAKSLLNFRGHWGNPKVSDISKIGKKIKTLSRNQVVRIGGMTDCFQPIENDYKVTYNTILWLNFYKIPYLIVTKSAIVSDDKYLKIYDKKLAHFQISISSTQNENIENCSSVADRIKSIELLYQLGYDVSLRLSPYLPELTDLDLINSINCKKILVEFLKASPAIKKNFNIDYSDYSLYYGGYSNLQLNKKIELIENIKGFEQVSVGEYVSDHYIYFRENVNFNKNDCCNLTLNLPNKTYFQTSLNFTP